MDLYYNAFDLFVIWLSLCTANSRLVCVLSQILTFFADLPRSTLTVTPDSPVFTGETVNLTCVIETYSDWRYEWYKDSVMLQSSDRYTVNRDTLTIRGATESDQGQYWCRGQRDRRPKSSQSSSVSLSVTGELNIIFLINLLYYMSGQYECHTFFWAFNLTFNL